MKSVLISILVAAVLAGAGALVMVGLLSTPTRTKNTDSSRAIPLQDEADNPFADFQIPEFELTNQQGETVTSAVLEGEITVLDFFFTTCPGPCPGMTAQMQRVQSQTAGTDVRLMSISVDGDDDTPEVLLSYANEASADLSRWTFLTGDPAKVTEIVQGGLKFEVSPIEDSPIFDENGQPRIGPSGTPLVNIVHPTRLLLVGPDRRLLGVYSYNNPAQIDELIARAKAAAG